MLDGVRDALLIFNPNAGRAKGLLSGALDRLRRTLREQGIETDLAQTVTANDAQQAARSAVQQSRQLVIACGGDGTLNAVVNGLAGSQVPLGLLPAGTANILAKELDLPKNAERAAERLAHGTMRRVPLGLLTTHEDGRTRYFLSVAGAGPDGAIVQAVNEQLKRRTGTLAFWYEGFRQLATYRFPRFVVTDGDQAVEGTMLVVGRTKHYGGPLRITTGVNFFDAEFELLVCTTSSRLLFLSYVPLALAGKVHGAPGTRFLKTSVFQCKPLDSPPAMLEVDGEPAGRLPAEFRIVPDALTLLTPPASPAHGNGV